MLTGPLCKDDDGRWQIVSGDRDYVLTRSDVCEVEIGGTWIETRIDVCSGLMERATCWDSRLHDKHYYAATRGVLLCEGLLARVRPGAIIV